MSQEVLDKPVVSDDADEQADTRQFVTFVVGGEVFAVDMAPVQEIIRVPTVVRVPLAPASMHGLANLRGRVLPIICLRRIFGFEELASDDSTRAVVIDLGTPLGFVVDRVASVINVEPDQIESVDTLQSTVKNELLTGMLKDVGGFAMVMVLDFAKLIAHEFAEIAAIARSTTAASLTTSNEGDEQDDSDSDELQLVSFTVSGQEYGIDIARIQEIVQVPETIVHVPNAPANVLGLITLRERLLPLVSLRSLFGLPARAVDEKSRIVVITLGQASVGVVTDTVSEVLRVPLSVVDGVPALLTRDKDFSDITQICRLNNGKRLVSIIEVDSMFRHSVVTDALKTVTNMDDEASVTASELEAADDDEQLVVFHVADGEFGVAIENVQEIVRVPDALTHVPKAPPFVEGVINLRGTVLPVIDQRKRLDLPPVERNDRQRIMVFLIGGVRTGFIVDAVIEVLKIPKTSIEAAPTLSSAQARLLGRVANLEAQKRMIQIIDPSELVTADDAAGLSAMSA